VTRWSYDSKGNVTNLVNADGKATQFKYDASGNLTNLIANENTQTNKFYYDSYGNLTNFTDALTHVTKFGYDKVGRLTNTIDALSRTNSFQWDARDRLTNGVNGASETNRWEYDGNGNVTSWSDGLGNAFTNSYDALNRLTTNNLPATGLFLRYGYDAGGNLTNVTDAVGHRVAFGYDALSRLTSVTNGVDKVWRYTVNAEGWRTRAIDPNAHTNSYGYNAVGEVTSWTNALTKVARFGYDSLGNLTNMLDAKSNYISFRYDAMSQVTNIVYGGLASSSFAYDAVGNLTNVVRRDSRVVELKYNTANLLTQKLYRASAGGTLIASISFYYNDANQLTNATWMAGGTSLVSRVGRYYDKAGRVTNETQTIQTTSEREVRYTFDAAGRRTSLRWPNGNVVNYHYNKNGWLTNVLDGAASVVRYEYDNAGRRTNSILSNGITTQYEYDNANQLTKVWNKNGATTNSLYRYGYDDAGNRTWVLQSRPANNYAANKGEVYRYDDANQLTNVVYDVNSPTNNPTGGTNDTRYVIDDAGNFVTNRVINGTTTNMTTFVVNAVNQYTSVNGTNYTYWGGPLVNDGLWSYTYDCEDRLTCASNTTTGVTVDYLYDAFGRMIRRNSTVGGVKDRRYYYDGWQIVEERDGVNNAENRYIYGTGINEVVKYIKADSANRFFTYDGLGSMTEVTGGDGNLQESYTYEVYGTVTMRNPGGTIITATGNKNRLHFTGYELDPDTGLYLARNRWYHPRLGRFIQSDPIGLAGGDLNLYRYCRNNPVNWVDPLGFAYRYSTDALILGVIPAPSGYVPYVFGDTPTEQFVSQVNNVAYLAENTVLLGLDKLSEGIEWAESKLGGKGCLAMVPAMGSVSRLGRFRFAAKVGGRAPEFVGGKITESGFLRSAEKYLGPGYKEVSSGRYVSSDGLRQLRFGAHEVRGTQLHGHFEAYDKVGGRVIENTRVNIIPD
jgi:RHS repeat-associated protein